MLQNLLSSKQDAIAARWIDLVFDSYPADSVKFLKAEGDRFSNPLGQTIHRCLPAILSELLGQRDPERLGPPLDELIRLRAVQEFTASEALAFVPALKQLVRQELAQELKQPGLAPQLERFDAQVDQLLLLAVDVYTSCREQIFQIRIDEVKRRSQNIMDRWTRLRDKPRKERK